MDNLPSDATQWAKMRQEIVESVRAELQNGLQSRVDQLESEKSELKQRCDTLHHTNSMILQRLFEGEDKISKLQEQVKSLLTSFEKAQRKAKYQEVVLKNQNWKYPLDIPTTDELDSLGIDEDECEQINYGITALAEITREMRMGEYINWVDPDPNETYFPVPYNGYKPHLTEFANALVEYQHTIDYMEDKNFSFALDIPLPREILDLLQNALHQTHFHELNFYCNNLEREGYINFIANCVKANTRLKLIRLQYVKIELSSDIELLCEAVNSNGSLKEVLFQNCDTEEGVFREILNKLKSKTVKKIELVLNGPTNLGPTDMSEFLSSNPSLSELSLCDNTFNEQDIVYISNLLRHSTTLHKLWIAYENPPNNRDLLESVIFDSSSLNTAYYSNHHTSLRLRYSWRWHNPVSYIEKFNTCNDPTLNRRKKIYTILSRRNRSRKNAALFDSDGISIKQIPQILSLLKPFSEHHLHDKDAIQGVDEVVPLSVAYEIMRDWKMPELYNLDSMDED
eukprot:scaffold25426_cov40-Cyclotella_meneghiniana.AAC.2